MAINDKKFTRIHFQDSYNLIEDSLPETFKSFKQKCLDLFNQRDPDNFEFEVILFSANANVALKEEEYKSIKNNLDDIMEFVMINLAEKNALNKDIPVVNEDYSLTLIKTEEEITIPLGLNIFEFDVILANNGRKTLVKAILKWERESDLSSFDYSIKQELKSTEKLKLKLKCTGLEKKLSKDDVGKIKKIIFSLNVGSKSYKSKKIEISAKII